LRHKWRKIPFTFQQNMPLTVLGTFGNAFQIQLIIFQKRQAMAAGGWDEL
jgi:hypothetical protein